jgi:hypothetical protein
MPRYRDRRLAQPDDVEVSFSPVFPKALSLIEDQPDPNEPNRVRIMGDAISGARPKFNEPALNQEIMRLRSIGHVTNLGFLTFEYLCVAAVIGAVVLVGRGRLEAGLAWVWDLPVLALAVVLMGGIQHRLAGLGHEAAHYSLLRNKFLNDLVGDLFCFFPLLGTVHFYRLFHLAHHQYTNDPERDPDLVTLGGSKMVDRFPMQRGEFIQSIYFRAITNPWAFANYLRKYVDINVLCRADNIYLERSDRARTKSYRLWPRLGATLGAIYVVGLVLVHWALTFGMKRPAWLVYEAIGGTLLVAGVAALLPDGAFFQSPLRQPYSGRFGGVLPGGSGSLHDGSRRCSCIWDFWGSTQLLHRIWVWLQSLVRAGRNHRYRRFGAETSARSTP